MYNEEPQVSRLVKELYKRHRGRLLLLLLLTIVIFLSMSVSHWLFGVAVEAVKGDVESRSETLLDTIFFWFAVIMGFSAVRSIVLFFTGVFRITTIQRILHYLRESLFDQVQLMELDWHHRHGAGELVTRTTRDCDMVRNATDASFQMVEIATMLTGSLLLLLSFHWQLFILPFVLILIALLLYYRQALVMVRLNRRTDDAYDEVTQDLTEGIAGVRVVKAFGLEEKRAQRFDVHVNHFIEHGLKAVKYAATRLPLPQLMVSMAHPWVLIWGIYLIYQQEPCTVGGQLFGVGHLLAALMAMTTLIFRLDTMGSAMRMIAEAIASLQRISEVRYARSHFQPGDRQPAAGPLRLRLDGVQVKDDQGHWILRDCSFTVEPDEIVALIGSTGSGKSIICSLLPRLKDTSAGTVTVEDSQGAVFDIRDCDPDILRRRIQVVPQESFLFSDTLANNVRLGNADAGDEAIWQALDAAGIGDFIRGLDDQLETKVGERGMNLSGGQKQRLCLARALLMEPDLLVLDDSTSALDAVTEEQIFETMRARKRGSSILLITTRLSSVLLADRVLLLADGAIIADDRHETLARHDRRYRELLCLDEETGHE